MLAVCEQTLLELEEEPDDETRAAIEQLTRRLYRLLELAPRARALVA
ncbi:MAG: hypothetical protein ACJ757_09050 [Gaiellaceae bacterium]